MLRDSCRNFKIRRKGVRKGGGPKLFTPSSHESRNFFQNSRQTLAGMSWFTKTECSYWRRTAIHTWADTKLSSALRGLSLLVVFYSHKFRCCRGESHTPFLATNPFLIGQR